MSEEVRVEEVGVEVLGVDRFELRFRDRNNRICDGVLWEVRVRVL